MNSIFIQQLIFNILLIVTAWYYFNLHIISDTISSIRGISLSSFLKNIADAMLYLVQIALYTIFFIIMWKLIVTRSDEELIVLPFEVSVSDEKSKGKYEGNTISNLLASEINWIKSTNQSKYAMIDYSKPDAYTPPRIKLSNASYEVKGIDSKIPSVINHDFEIKPNVGSMTLGGVSLSFQETLLYLRRLLWKNSSRYVSGSLQLTGSNCCIVALMQGYRTYTWNINTCVISDKDFRELIKSLAYQIYYDLLRDKNKQSYLKNWKCLRYFTEALSNYQMYIDDRQIKYLQEAERKIDLMKNEGTKECPLIYGLLYNIGYAYVNESKYGKAKDLFLDAYKLGISSGGAPIAITECLLHLDQEDKLDEFYNKAKERSEKLLAEYPNDIFESLVRAFSYYKLGEIEKALSIYEKIANKNEKIPYIYVWLSNCYSALGKDKKSIKIIEEGAKKFPKDSYIWSQMGMTYYNMFEYDKSLECCKKALELDENNFEALSTKSHILISRGNEKEAIEASDKAIDLAKHLATIWSVRGLVMGKAGRFSEAFNAHNEAIRKGKNSAYVWHLNRACTHSIKGEKKNCMSDLIKSIRLHPPYLVSVIDSIKNDPDLKDRITLQDLKDGIENNSDLKDIIKNDPNLCRLIYKSENDLFPHLLIIS